ncbi:hypothetical protein E5288_WYG014906 [Bos mutus]|uniref:Uncharacterized protein n=1 Tax=Bos mutus TaxID=72004 RepID=A0A6B0SAD6_9CETA|nr:hypothetical protein [Bos mutus]
MAPVAPSQHISQHRLLHGFLEVAHRNAKVEDLQFRVEEESITKGDWSYHDWGKGVKGRLWTSVSVAIFSGHEEMMRNVVQTAFSTRAFSLGGPRVNKLHTAMPGEMPGADRPECDCRICVHTDPEHQCPLAAAEVPARVQLQKGPLRGAQLSPIFFVFPVSTLE